ncbi:MAG: hypothetical protein LBC99_05420 [Spirochaetota bacterium]|nr:hypothetical protein [Spirochaetota bacterium]
MAFPYSGKDQPEQREWSPKGIPASRHLNRRIFSAKMCYTGVRECTSAGCLLRVAVYIMIKVYLDNCCYNRPFDNSSDKNVYLEAMAKLFIQSLIRYGDIILAGSFILYSEISDNPHKYKLVNIMQFVDEYTKIYIGGEMSSKALAIAQDIMQTGIKASDAAHIACAILAGCDYFITTDKRILKYKSESIQIINPTHFIQIWEKLS